MKRTLLSLLVVFTASWVAAAPIDSRRALQIASDFTATHTPATMRKAQAKAVLTIAYTARTGGVNDFYVINRGKGGGYVIVAADDAAYPVLGYADSGSFDLSSMPVNAQIWLRQYQRQIRYAAARGLKAQAPALRTDSVQPLLGNIKWGQGTYYNRLVPIKGTPTGCVATAMGQIMYYYRWPDRGTGKHRYVTTTHHVADSVDFDHPYLWDDMTPSLDAGSSDAAKQAVATLLHDAGVAVNMDYDASGSGAYSERITQALARYFKYNKGARLVKRDFYTASDWTAMLNNELRNARPVIYDGATSDLSMGHSFICDGYNAQGYYHFNFGWGGSSDGYFLLTAIPYSDFDFTTGEANNDGFNYVQDMVIGFEPDRDGSSVMAPERIIADNLAAVSARVKRSTPVKLSAYEVYNPSNTDLDITALGFFVKDSKGAVVDTAVAYRGYTPAGEPLDSLSALYEPATTLPAGDYTLTFGFCKKGSDEMKPAEIALGEPNGYSLHITADSAFYASLGQCDFQMQLITSPDTLTSDKPSTVTLRVTNRGGLYDGIVHFRLNVAGDAVKKHWYTSPNQTFTVGAGETKDLVFNQIFTLPGDDNYVITFFDRSNRPFFTDTIPVIGGEKEPDLLLVKETYFTPRDYQVPVNCLILNAEIRNDGGRYDGKMTVRIYDESNYFCDGAHMDTTHVVLPGGGAVTTVKLHGTYDTSNDWSLSNVRYATVLDLLTHTYLKPSKYNMHEFTLGAKDPSVTWTPETGIRDINSSAFKGKVSFDLNDRLLTVKADVTLASVSIFNANGELLIRQYEGSTIDLSALRPGVYVAVASAGNGQRAEKIVLK